MPSGTCGPEGCAVIAVQPDQATLLEAGSTVISNYLGHMFSDEVAPQAYLVDSHVANVEAKAHFHRTDQFQVILSAGFKMGSHSVAPISIHYVDSFSPYGPLIGDDSGFVFYVLRAHAENQEFVMPESRGTLEKARHDLGLGPRRGYTATVGLSEGWPADIAAPEIVDVLSPDVDGVAAFTMRVPSEASVDGPDPSAGGGQFYIVVNGTWEHEGSTLGPRSLVWVASDEPAPLLRAGPEGLEVMGAQFSRDAAPIPAGAPTGLSYRDLMTPTTA